MSITPYTKPTTRVNKSNRWYISKAQYHSKVQIIGVVVLKQWHRKIIWFIICYHFTEQHETTDMVMMWKKKLSPICWKFIVLEIFFFNVPVPFISVILYGLEHGCIVQSLPILQNRYVSVLPDIRVPAPGTKCILFPNDDKENWGNHQIVVNWISRRWGRKERCSWGRKHFIHPWHIRYRNVNYSVHQTNYQSE